MHKLSMIQYMFVFCQGRTYLPLSQIAYLHVEGLITHVYKVPSFIDCLLVEGFFLSSRGKTFLSRLQGRFMYKLSMIQYMVVFASDHR